MREGESLVQCEEFTAKTNTPTHTYTYTQRLRSSILQKEDAKQINNSNKLLNKYLERNIQHLRELFWILVV